MYLPRDRYTTPVRIQLLETLRRAFGGSDVDFNLLLTESVMARVHVVVSTPDGALTPDPLAVEAELAALVRAWVDDLHDAFVAARGEEAGVDAYRRWRDAFPVAYQYEVDASDAVADVAVIDDLEPGGDLAIRLEAPGDDHVARIKLYRTGGALVLSDVMPLLEHLGVTVVDERPVRDRGTRRRCALDLVVRGARRRRARRRSVIPTSRRASPSCSSGCGRAPSRTTGSTGSCCAPGCTARDIVIVRTLCQYLRQAGVRFTDAYLADTLAANPEAGAADGRAVPPAPRPGPRPRDEAVEAALVAELAGAVDAVVSLDADRILRALWHVVVAAVRTNAYRSESYLAVKFDPAALEFLPRPRPQHEIWVASPTVEGVHLRAGDIARGGIRWSDRREDFRTEVLGLMKAQTVKNAVIVPVGAKGGFVVKRGEMRAAYQTFIRALLELTDNLVDGEVVPPERVVRRDGDDPYLVVAADKGTGAFSDVANELAAERGYWLGDAFASGGSAGFDHKEMGITSRGAWISVRGALPGAGRRRRHRGADRRRDR